MKKRALSTVTGLLSVLCVGSVANAITWSGAAPDDFWASPGNWVGGQVPGETDDVTFDATGGGGTVDLNGAAVTIKDLMFNSGGYDLLNTGSPVAMSVANLTNSAGYNTISDTLVLGGPVTVSAGTLAVGQNVLAVGGGGVQIAAGATLKASGDVSRSVSGARGGLLEALGPITLGNFGDPAGYDFQGKLLVGPHAVLLKDLDWAELYGANMAGGALVSMNGIALQETDVFGFSGPIDYDEWLTGHGSVPHGGLHMESDPPNSNMAGIRGDGPTEKIDLAIVTGTGLLEYAEIDVLGFLSTRPGAPVLGFGTTVVGGTFQNIWGPGGSAEPFGDRDYDQVYSYGDATQIAGGLEVRLRNDYTPQPTDRYEILVSWEHPVSGPGSYTGWFSNVNLGQDWPNPTEWVWELEDASGRYQVPIDGTPRGDFFGATLMMIPEPGTLVLLASGGIALLVWRRRRNWRPRNGG